MSKWHFIVIGIAITRRHTKGRQGSLGLRITPQYQKLFLRSKPVLYSQLQTRENVKCWPLLVRPTQGALYSPALSLGLVSLPLQSV